MQIEDSTIESEALLWTILRHFETLALRQYEAVAPDLVDNGKRLLLARLSSLAPDDSALAGSDLGALVDRLESTVTSGDRRKVLLGQAFLLECVGKAIYENVGRLDHVSQATRDLCALADSAGAETRAAAIDCLRAEFESADALFAAFIATAPEILRALGPFGEAMDRELGESLGISFGDLLGELLMDIDAFAARLGLDRRKLTGFLMAAMMEA